MSTTTTRVVTAPKDLLTLAGLGRENLLRLLILAARLKLDPLSEHRRLRGETVVLYFAKPSTRTRISFETAVVRLGGTPLSVGPHDLQLDRGETIEDTARVLSGYARAIVVRTYRDDDVARLAAAASIPVVNALTDRHHPCQALADLMTILEVEGVKAKRRVAFVGDGTNVAHSLVEGCALLGVDVAVATPTGYELDPAVVAGARAAAARMGAHVLTTDDPIEAVTGAGIVYTDVWLSMGVAEAERQARLRDLEPYRVDARLMARASADAVFMHCLPAHRGEEVTQDVIDGPRSRVFQQAANRLPTEQAVLLALITRSLRPASDGTDR